VISAPEAVWRVHGIGTILAHVLKYAHPTSATRLANSLAVTTRSQPLDARKNQWPMEAAVGDRDAVFHTDHAPSMLNSGPRRLPRLIALHRSGLSVSNRLQDSARVARAHDTCGDGEALPAVAHCNHQSPTRAGVAVANVTKRSGPSAFDFQQSNCCVGRSDLTWGDQLASPEKNSMGSRSAASMTVGLFGGPHSRLRDHKAGFPEREAARRRRPRPPSPPHGCGPEELRRTSSKGSPQATNCRAARCGPSTSVDIVMLNHRRLDFLCKAGRGFRVWQ